jgi:hypothetical protein
MNCIEFRSLYNLWLDGRKSTSLLPEAALHARECSECGTYAEAMLEIDEGLHNIPDVPLPKELLAYSGGRGPRTPARGRELSFFIRSGAAFALPALASWIITLYLPPGWQFAVQSLLVSGAMVLCAATSLRPRFIA